MKITFLLLIAMASCAYGQGTLIYDQSSATNPATGSSYAALITGNQPMGQSFTPALSSIGFVQLNFVDAEVGNQNGLGATIFVNLWSGSISNGTLLSSTDPIYIPTEVDHLVTNFSFSTAVTLTPGTTYYLQPYIQSGDVRMSIVIGGVYAGGTWYFDGAPNPNNYSLWFREGIVDTPEPSSSVLILLGSGLFLYARRKHSRT